MAQPPRPHSDPGPESVARAVDRQDALWAILTVMRQRPRAFEPAGARAAWARLGALAVEAGGGRRVA